MNWLFDNLIVPLFKNQLANRERDLITRIIASYGYKLPTSYELGWDSFPYEGSWEEKCHKAAKEYDKQLKEGFGGHD